MKKTIFLEECKMNTRKWLFGCSLLALLYVDNTIAGDPLNLKSDEMSKQNFVEVNSTSENQKAHKDLFKYIKGKNIEGIKDILKSDEKALNKRNAGGQPALVMYARDGNLEMVKWLMENFRENLDINISDFKKDTALIDAAYKKHYNVVEYLVGNGADINIQGEHGNTALIFSIDLCEENKCEENKMADFLLNQSEIKLDFKGQDGKTALFWAVEAKNKEMVKRLIEKRADPNIADDEENTPLMIAVKRYLFGFVLNEIAELLLNHPDINLNFKGQNGKTSLFRAVEAGNEEMVKRLIEKGADPNIADDEGNTPLMKAVMRGDTKIVKLLLASPKHVGADKVVPLLTAYKSKKPMRDSQLMYHYDQITKDVNAENNDGNTALFFAFNNENWEIVNLLLKRGAKIDSGNESFKEKLKCAVNSEENASFDTVKRLLQFRKNFDDKDLGDPEFGRELLKYAIEGESFDKVWLLMEKGVAFDGLEKEEFSNMLECAVRSEKDASFDIVKVLLRFIKNFDDKDSGDSKLGRKLLRHAIKNKNFDKAWLLIEKGADINGLKKEFANNELYKDLLGIYSAVKNKTNVNIENENGDTPLLRVVKYKPIQKVKFDLMNRLLESGANINAVNKSGWTPLFYVKGVKTAQLLIDHGANVYWRSENDGHTWLTHTMVYKGLPTEEDKLPMIEFILKQLSEEKINESTNVGNTALHMASRWNYAEISKMLVNHGADIHLRNGKGETPLMRAAQFDSTKVARVLLDTNEISPDEINKALEYAKKFHNTKSIELLSNAVKKMKQQWCD